MRAFIVVATILSILQQPTFRSRVDLIRLDVRVVDGDGRPVRDLRPEDFTVTLDGSPRQVTFARFYGPDDVPPQQRAEEPVVVATNTTAAPGRVVVIVVDLESIDPGSEKLIFDTTAGLVDGLSPADAVGLLLIPGKGVELTRDHQKVRDALKSLRGLAPAPLSHYTYSARDAEAILSNDFIAREEVVGPGDCTVVTAPVCSPDPKEAARHSLLEISRRLRLVVGSLTSLFGNLEPFEAPKSVVFVSAGLLRRSINDDDFLNLRRRAATAGVSFSVVQLQQPANNVTVRMRASVTPNDLREGLDGVAAAADGNVYYGVARATGAFERIRSEIVHSYQLGVESLPTDADDRRHRLKVEVKRPGVSVITRKELVIPKTPPRALNPVDLLAQPVDLTETPIAAAMFTTRGTEPSTLKVILLVEQLGAKSAADGASYALTIQQDGKNVFETADRFAAGSSRAAIAAQLAPGRYRLRTAVVDSAGRPGSIDVPIMVGLRQAGPRPFSDLILGDTSGGKFLPLTRASASTKIETAIELYGADPTHLDGLTVTIEAVRPGQSSPSVQVPAKIEKTDNERRNFAGAQLAPGSLAPGTWIISAVVRREDVVVGQVSRVLSIE